MQVNRAPALSQTQHNDFEHSRREDYKTLHLDYHGMLYLQKLWIDVSTLPNGQDLFSISRIIAHSFLGSFSNTGIFLKNINIA